MTTKATKAYPRKGQMIKGYRYAGTPTFDHKYGHLASGSFPADCIAECSASGAVDASVQYWVSRLEFADSLETVRNLAERYLKEFGAWDDLETADIETLAQRVLWIACGDIKEQGEWLGLVH